MPMFPERDSSSSLSKVRFSFLPNNLSECFSLVAMPSSIALSRYPLLLLKCSRFLPAMKAERIFLRNSSSLPLLLSLWQMGGSSSAAPS